MSDTGKTAPTLQKEPNRDLELKLKKHPETAAIPIIILCGRNSEREAKANEKRAEYAIYKDIDILTQLDTALAVALAGTKPMAAS